MLHKEKDISRLQKCKGKPKLRAVSRTSQEWRACGWTFHEQILWRSCLGKVINLNKELRFWVHSVQVSSVAQSCLTLCDPMNCSMPGLPIHHQIPESNQTHVHRVGDAIQPFHPLSSPSPPTLTLSQHLSLFKWVSSLHQVAKVLEFQLQHQSFQWTSRTDLL